MTESEKEEVERHTLWKLRRHSAVSTTLSITDGSRGKWKIPIVSKLLIHQFMKGKLETEEVKMNVGANIQRVSSSCTIVLVSIDFYFAINRTNYTNTSQISENSYKAHKIDKSRPLKFQGTS